MIVRTCSNCGTTYSVSGRGRPPKRPLCVKCRPYKPAPEKQDPEPTCGSCGRHISAHRHNLGLPCVLCEVKQDVSEETEPTCVWRIPTHGDYVYQFADEDRWSPLPQYGNPTSWEGVARKGLSDPRGWGWHRWCTTVEPKGA